jgi:antitoxin VapB
MRQLRALESTTISVSVECCRTRKDYSISPTSLIRSSCKNNISVVYTGIHVNDKAMTLAKTRTFRSGNSEAIRLPKDVAFGEDVELVVVRSGDVVTLYPAATSIPEMIARLEALPRPASIEERDDEELPEPAGL